MTGDRYIAQSRAVPHQLFSTMGVVVGLARGVLGLDPNAARGEFDFRPALPADWPSVRFSNFDFGAHKLSGEIRQSPTALRLSLDDDSAEPLNVHFKPALPWGAHMTRVTVNGKPAEFHQLDSSALSRASVQFRMERHATVAVEFTAGIAIVPAVPHPEPGDRTEQIKILKVDQKPGAGGHREITLTVAGLGGRTYTLDAITPLANVTAEGATVEKTQQGISLKIPFEGSGYVQRTIRLSF
jgi:hypothetical protein